MFLPTWSFGNEHQLSVYIGRFQPVHKGHIQLIHQGLEKADRLLLLLGQPQERHIRTLKNPWTWEERAEMIHPLVSSEQKQRLIIKPIYDVNDDDALWVSNVKRKAYEECPSPCKILLIGFHKDSSSSYLDLFQEWDFLEIADSDGMNATAIRTNYFRGQLQKSANVLEESTLQWLNEFSKKSFVIVDQVESSAS
jgi:bifunctional NMN adenylyltransferase/nudix hydrolase